MKTFFEWVVFLVSLPFILLGFIGGVIIGGLLVGYKLYDMIGR